MKKFLKKHWKLCIFILLLIGAGVFGLRYLKGKAENSIVTEVSYKEASVVRQNITQSLSGSGSLTAANSYSVSALYSGEILSSTFEEGDQVLEGQVLYTIDTTDSDTEEKRYIQSAIDGYIASINVEAGDEVKQGQTVATVIANDNMIITVPFTTIDAKTIEEGDEATVILDGSFEELSGTVDTVSGLVQYKDGLQVQNVTVLVKNQGALSTSQYASVSVNGVSAVETGTFSYESTRSINAETSGTVGAVYVREGSRVKEGETIVYLEQDENAIREVESPISGTVIDKAYKTGENADSGRTLCTIYDLSYLEMSLSVDELDIANVEVGQKVTVTADATEGITYEGVVTKVSVVGSSFSGTATFPVTIRITDFGTLLPSMSADAVIVLNGAENVLTVPNEAVQRGNMVMLTQDSPTAVQAIANGSEVNENGYVYVNVEIGLSDDDNTEIKSGLQEGDTVVYTVSSASGFGDMAGFSFGDMGGGSMPSGGGSMPSGGGSMPSSGGSRPSGGGF